MKEHSLLEEMKKGDQVPQQILWEERSSIWSSVVYNEKKTADTFPEEGFFCPKSCFSDSHVWFELYDKKFFEHTHLQYRDRIA